MVVDTALATEITSALAARGARRRGRHLRFSCPAHDDRHPSADYDPERCVWICRACRAGGGARDLARRLGLAGPGVPPVRPQRHQPCVPPPPPGMDRTAWREAWTAIVEAARRQEARLAAHRLVWRVADGIRRRHQAATDARRIASWLGDNPRSWALLARAARVQTAAAAFEAELDAVIRLLWPSRATHGA